MNYESIGLSSWEGFRSKFIVTDFMNVATNGVDMSHHICQDEDQTVPLPTGKLAVPATG